MTENTIKFQNIRNEKASLINFRSVQNVKSTEKDPV